MTIEDRHRTRLGVAGQMRGCLVSRVLNGKWTLLGLLGEGGMSAVYEAVHRNGRRAAIKVLRAELALRPQIRSRFLREGALANRVGHPGAVAVIDDDVTPDGLVYLVMELLDGETLEARRKRTPVLEPVETLRILDRVLDVLACAHDKGIAHRDIKPHNIFCTSSGDVKLLDFGIAVLHEGHGDEREGATVNGTLLGTPAYMAPEQARGRWTEVDHRTDLWAAGATLFASLAGRHVHQAETASELLIVAATQAAPSLREFRPDLPASLIECVDRALAPNKAARFSDARAMQHSLAVALEELTATRLATTPTRAVHDENTTSEESATFAPRRAPVLRARGRRRWLTIGATSLLFGATLAARSSDTAQSATNAGREPQPSRPSAIPAGSGAGATPLPSPLRVGAPRTSGTSSAEAAPRLPRAAPRLRRLDPKAEAATPVDTESALDRWN